MDLVLLVIVVLLFGGMFGYAFYWIPKQKREAEARSRAFLWSVRGANFVDPIHLNDADLIAFSPSTQQFAIATSQSGPKVYAYRDIRDVLFASETFQGKNGPYEKNTLRAYVRDDEEPFYKFQFQSEREMAIWVERFTRAKEQAEERVEG